MSKVVYFINSIGFVLILLSVSVFTPAFNLGYYSREYDLYQIPESIGVSKSELMDVTENLLNYMRGKDESLNAVAVVRGEEREFFNQKEALHMADVRELITGGFFLRNLCIAFFIAACIYTGVKKDYAQALHLSFLYLTSVLTAAALLIIVISLDFDRSFTVFHKIFFNNDLWILDPATDLLINIVPFNFFVDLAKLIAAIFSALCAAALIVLKVAGKKLKHP